MSEITGRAFYDGNGQLHWAVLKEDYAAEVQRLEAKVTALEAENGRLKAPVSAAEWNGAWQELARQSCIGKYQFSKIASFLIAARAQQPSPAQEKPTPAARILGQRKAKEPCSDCVDGWCTMNCGPAVKG